MRRYLTLLIFALVLLLSACSFTTNFVVLNESARPVSIKYRIKNSRYEPFEEIGKPAKIAEANLRDRDKQWRALESGEYELDSEARTVTVELMPHEALRVLAISNYSSHDDEDNISGRFMVDEISVNGASGEVRFQGDEARRRFLEESHTLYVLTYK